jgi:hypothetical protein
MGHVDIGGLLKVPVKCLRGTAGAVVGCLRLAFFAEKVAE